MEEKKIGEIKEELRAAEDTMLPHFIESYKADRRAGVVKIVEQAKKRLSKYEEELERIELLKS